MNAVRRLAVVATLAVGVLLTSAVAARATPGGTWLDTVAESIAAGQAAGAGDGTWLGDVAGAVAQAQGPAARPDATAASPGLIELGPDGTWLGGSETSNLKGMAGGLMAAGLVVAVASLVVSAAVWSGQRLGWWGMSEKGLTRMGWSVGGAVVLGCISGLVGWSFTLA